jgi:hypothetical protein
MKPWGRVGTLLLVIMGLVSILWLIAHSQATAEPAMQTMGAALQKSTHTTVAVQPSVQTVGRGERFTITVEIAGLDSPLSAFQFDLTYDPVVIDLAGIDDGRFLSTTGRNAVCPQPAHLAGGTLRFACAAAGEAAGPTGSGPLAILTFTALNRGTSTLTLSGLQLPGDGIPPAPIAATAEGGEVEVSVAMLPFYLPMVFREAFGGQRTTPPSPAVALGDDQSAVGRIHSQVVYPLTVTNRGSDTDTFSLSVTGASWEAVLSSQTSGPLLPGGEYTFTLTVTVPDVPTGSQDVATVMAVSGLDPGVSASTQVTTTATRPDYEIYLPLIDRDSRGEVRP